jgi:hypothetical protein
MNFVKPHVSGFAKEVWRERERGYCHLEEKN